MEQDFVIPLNGLPAGESNFHWRIGKAFLDSFGQKDVLDVDVEGDCIVVKRRTGLDIDLDLEGSVTVPCDRCLEDLDLPVEEQIRLRIKFTDDPGAMETDAIEGDREVVYTKTGSPEVDLRQIAYDYIMLSVPIVRVHPEGGCNPQVTAYIHEGELETEAQASTDSPFAGLKDLLD